MKDRETTAGFLRDLDTRLARLERHTHARPAGMRISDDPNNAARIGADGGVYTREVVAKDTPPTTYDFGGHIRTGSIWVPMGLTTEPTCVTWTDEFTDLSAWHLDPTMTSTSDVPIFFEASGGAISGRDAYACWISGCADLGIPSGRTVISTMTRNEAAGGNQFIEVVCHNFWQRHVSLSLSNPDCNLRVRLFLYTHYDPATPSSGRRALLSVDNWTGGTGAAMRYNCLVLDPTGNLAYPFGTPTSTSPTDWAARFADGDMTFRLECGDDGHSVVSLDDEVLLDTVNPTERLGDYQGVALWWDLQMGTNPAYVRPSLLSAAGGCLESV